MPVLTEKIANDFNLSQEFAYHLIFVCNIPGSNTNNKFRILANVRESIRNGTLDSDGGHYDSILEDIEEDMNEIISKAR